jgi:hypothetical protein
LEGEMKIELKRGDTYSNVIDVELTTIVNGLEVKTPFELTGYSALFTMKTNANLPDSKATVQKSLTVNESLHNILFHLTEIDTNHVGNFVFDVQIMNPDIVPRQLKTIVDGTIEIKNDVTKATFPVQES